MVSNPEGFTNNSPISPMTSTPVKKPSARKLLCLFTNILDAKKKTSTRRVGSANSNARQLNMKLNHGNWGKTKSKFKNQ